MKNCLLLLLFSITVPNQFNTRTERYLAVGYMRPTNCVASPESILG